MGKPLIPARRPVGFFFAKSSASMLDTFWITYGEGSRPPKPDTAPSYSLIAHELTHILGDLGHTREHPNLMRDDESAGAKSGDLDDAQCAAIRQLH